MIERDTAELRRKIGDRDLVVSVSGGKDSAAVCLHLRELGLPYRAIFFDTGWEHADTYRYLEEYLPTKIGPIERLIRRQEMRTPELEAMAVKYEDRIGWYSPLIRLVNHKGMFPARKRPRCTSVLKVKQAANYPKPLQG